MQIMKPRQSPAFLASASVPLRRSRVTTCARRPRATPFSIRCIADPNKKLTSQQLDEWKQVSTLLQELNTALSSKDADKLVARAFGWGSQRFWRGDVKEEAPSLTQVRESVEFLREVVGLDDTNVGLVVKKFPEVLRLTMERMRENVGFVQKNYPHIKGAVLANSVKETPAVLGFDFDCEGDCKSECARCWVQF